MSLFGGQYMRVWRIALISNFVAPVALAQVRGPYAGLERRSIKALSEQQIADLRAGRGMGLALAAELNGYPGPLHVIDLAADLGLSDAQIDAVKRLYSSMKAEVVPLGERLIAEEERLDREFAGKTITESGLTEALARIGSLQGTLRTAHLKYHLETVKLLTSHQVIRYGELRGYAGGAPSHHGKRVH
jgi:hypothetical protein